MGCSPLVAAIEDAFTEAGASVALVSEKRMHPRRFYVVAGELSFPVWIYIWTLTHGGGAARPRDEYRIQLTSVKPPLDLLSEERVRLLAKAGCHSVNVGIEAGDERIRAREMLGRDMSDDQIISACRFLRRHGIKILANNMLGLPGCSFEDDLKTLRLNQQCRCDYSLVMLWQPYPGTRLAEYAKTHGFYKGDYSDLDFTYYGRSHLHFGTEAERTRIENLQKLFAVAVALPASTRVVSALTRLRPNRVFRAVFRSMYLIFHQSEIFPHQMGVHDWMGSFRHIAEAN